MKKKITALIITATAVITAFCTAAAGFDANDYDYNDYDSGSSGDFSDWDWGDDDDDYAYFGGSDDGGDSGGSAGLFGGIGGAVIVILIVVFLMTKKSGKTGGRSASVQVRSGQGGGQGRGVIVPDRTTQIEDIIKKNDPNFSAGDFVTFAKEVYMDIEDAWCKRDLKEVRPVMHENLYNMTNRQIRSKIEQGVIYHYESIAVNTAYLTSYAKDKQFEYLTVYLNARMIDYQTDEKTGNIIKGDKTTRWDMRYKMKFVRSAGVVTKTETSEAKRHNCPNCGAPLEMTSSGVCDYCGSTVTTGQYSWVLTEFTTVRNDTTDEGIKTE